MDRKSISLPVELKGNGEAGQFRATFSFFNTIDKDNDVTLPGAFQKGQQVRIAAWGHDWASLPVGKGVINFDAEKAYVDGEFLLNTTAGRDTHETIKAMGALQDWSYGFTIKRRHEGDFDGKTVRFLDELDVHEVSPVMIGAGIGTRTDFVKSGEDLEEPAVSLRREIEYLARLKSRAIARGKEGRTLSAANRERLKRHLETLVEIQGELETLLRDTDPKSASNALIEFLRLQQIRASHFRGVKG